MQYLLELSKENPPLSKAEARSIIRIDSFDENILTTKFFSSDKKEDILNQIKRLSYTKKCYELIKTIDKHSSDSEEIYEALEKIDYQKYYEKSFALKMLSLSSVKKGIEEKKVAEIIHSRLTNPVVDLKKPVTAFFLIKSNDKLYVAKEIWINKEDHNQRKTSLKIANHPIALKPTLQRAMVNLSGLETGTIIDPFAGTGGILIESMLCGLNGVGYDIKQDILDLAKKDFESLKLKGYVLEKKDSTKLEVKDIFKEEPNKKSKVKNSECENLAIVTEFPYGRNTSIDKSKLGELYMAFFNNLSRIVPLKSGLRLVCSMPDDIDYTEIVKDWKIENKFNYYIHGSLSINILVLKR